MRVENAWPALVSIDLFDAVQQALHERAPRRRGLPAWAASSS